jgi:hypothetical protein
MIKLGTEAQGKVLSSPSSCYCRYTDQDDSGVLKTKLVKRLVSMNYDGMQLLENKDENHPCTCSAICTE